MKGALKNAVRRRRVVARLTHALRRALSSSRPDGPARDGRRGSAALVVGAIALLTLGAVLAIWSLVRSFDSEPIASAPRDGGGAGARAASSTAPPSTSAPGAPPAGGAPSTAADAGAPPVVALLSPVVRFEPCAPSHPVDAGAESAVAAIADQLYTWCQDAGPGESANIVIVGSEDFPSASQCGAADLAQMRARWVHERIVRRFAKIALQTPIGASVQCLRGATLNLRVASVGPQTSDGLGSSRRLRAAIVCRHAEASDADVLNHVKGACFFEYRTQARTRPVGP